MDFAEGGLHDDEVRFVPLNCEAIVRSAAYSTECASAVFLRLTQSSPTVAAEFGHHTAATLAAADHLLARVAALAPTEILVIDDLTLEMGNGIPLAHHVRFVAVIQVVDAAANTLGALFVADPAARAGLSRAQKYVLRSHAEQIAATLDIQACRRIEAPSDDQRAERLRLLESVVVNANDAVLITEAEPIDLPGPRIVYVNRAFEKTTGYSEAEVLGATPRILQSETIDRTSLRRLKEALARWKPVEVELLNRRKDGTEFWVELSIVPVANELGWFTHWVSVQRDVSDRKQTEEIATRARIAEAENRAYEAEINERRSVEARLLYEVYHDHLTKLRNRAFFMERLELALSDAGRECHSTLLFLDLDGFKLVNDSLGHRAGDELLVIMAKRLRHCIRSQDILARIGGDEFAVLIEDGGIEAGVQVAEHIVQMISQPVTLGAQRIFPSCSIGIAQSGDAHLKPDEFLRNADIAMYEAKKSRLGGYAIYAESMHSDISATLLLQTDLRQAIARGELRVFYQLICSPADSRVTGVEALLRWQHPQRGLISPLTFIPMAEEIGIIRDLGRWVMAEACRQLQTWNRTCAGIDLTMSVNVSGDELRDPAFVSELQSVFTECGLDPSRLQLEITESIFLRQPELIGAVLQRIRALGIRIALDDFGTGFSSLGYVDKFQIDAIKIDRSFVATMLTRQRTLAIIDTIIKLGKALHLQIVAEGVETDEQRIMLAELECSHAQGYLFAAPVPADEATFKIEVAHAAMIQSKRSTPKRHSRKSQA